MTAGPVRTYPRYRTGSLGCLGAFSVLCLIFFTVMESVVLWWLDPAWLDSVAFWRGERYAPQPILTTDPAAIEQARRETAPPPADPYEHILVAHNTARATTTQYTVQSGAEVTSYEGATFSIPAGAIRDDQPVSLTPVSSLAPAEAPKDFLLAGPMYNLRVGDHPTYQFAKPVPVTMPYSPLLFPDEVASDLRIVTYENGKWVSVPSIVDKENFTVTANITHASPEGLGWFGAAKTFVGRAGAAIAFFNSVVKPLLELYTSNPGQFLVWYDLYGAVPMTSVYESEHFAVHYYDHRVMVERRQQILKEKGPGSVKGDVPGIEWEPLSNQKIYSYVSGPKKDKAPIYVQDLAFYLEEGKDDLEKMGFKIDDNQATYKQAIDNALELVSFINSVIDKKRNKDKPKDDKDKKDGEKDDDGIFGKILGAGKDKGVELLSKHLGKRIHVVVTPLEDIEESSIGGLLLVDNDMKIGGKEQSREDLAYVMQWAARRALLHRVQANQYNAIDPLTWRSSDWFNKATAEYLAHRSMKDRSVKPGEWPSHYLKQQPWILMVPQHISTDVWGPRGGYAYAAYYRWLEEQGKVDMVELIKSIQEAGPSVINQGYLWRKFDTKVREALKSGDRDPLAEFALAYYHQNLEKEIVAPFEVANRLRTETMPQQSHMFTILALSTANNSFALNTYETANVQVTPWKVAYFPFNLRGISSERKPKLVIETKGMDFGFNAQYFGYVAPFHVGKDPKPPFTAFPAKPMKTEAKIDAQSGSRFTVVTGLGNDTRDGVSFIFGDSNAPTGAAKFPLSGGVVQVRRWPLLAPAWIKVDHSAKDGSVRLDWHPAELKSAKGDGAPPFKEYRLYRKRADEAEYPEKPYRTLQDETFTDQPGGTQTDNYTYVVTVADRLNNESEPSPRSEEDPFIGTWLGAVREESGLNLRIVSERLVTVWEKTKKQAEAEIAATQNQSDREGKQMTWNATQSFVEPLMVAVGQAGPVLEQLVKFGFPPIEFKIYRKDGNYMLEFTRIGGLALQPGEVEPIPLERTSDDRTLALKLKGEGLENHPPLLLHSPSEGKIRQNDPYLFDHEFVIDEGKPDEVRVPIHWKFRWKFVRTFDKAEPSPAATPAPQNSATTP